MLFWSIAIAVTAIACAALLYAGLGRTVTAEGAEASDPNRHFRRLLDGIEADEANGKIDPDQAIAAKGELAREMLRAKTDASPVVEGTLGRGTLLAGLGATAVVAFGIYAYLGRPDMPTMPLADRPELVAQNMNLGDAIAQIEARLKTTPDDVRGWTVIAPAYVEEGRYGDAVNAYRRIMALSGATPGLETRLAEALLLDANGTGSDEAMQLLTKAADADPTLVQARLYLAAELMRQKHYTEAAMRWKEAIALGQGDENWLPAARQGLQVAENGGVDATAEQQTQMIQGMVGGLADRLAASGGSVEEWTRLIQSYLVLDERDKAQAAYDSAVAAYPAAFDRGELDTLALGAGLKLNGGTP